MSVTLRSVIPLLAVIESVTEGLHYYKNKLLTFKATVHEDNQGELTLGNLETGRCATCSQFYALKLHWFRSWLKQEEIKKLLFLPFYKKNKFPDQTASLCFFLKSSIIYGLVKDHLLWFLFLS